MRWLLVVWLMVSCKGEPTGSAPGSTPDAAPSAEQRMRAGVDRHARAGEPVLLLSLPPAVVDAIGRGDRVPSADALIERLRGPQRVIAVIPPAELCALRAGDAPAHVLDPDLPYVIVTNRLTAGETDRNPLATVMLRERPALAGPPLGVFQEADKGGRFELVGVSLPGPVKVGESFAVTFVWHVVTPTAFSWQVLAHFDGGGARIQGDHPPKCPTNMWKAGDWIVDRFMVQATGHGLTSRSFDAWAGLFTSDGRGWHNMPVAEGEKDENDRVRVGRVELR